MMDIDLDFSFAPSETIYGTRAIKLDTANTGKCYLGSANAMCVGVSEDGSQSAPGLVGNTTTPFILGDTTNGGNIAVWGPGRKCLISVDPNFGGQLKPGDLVISSDGGLAKKASPFGPWNQWVIGIALSFASSNQMLNLKVVIFPWSPTGS